METFLFFNVHISVTAPICIACVWVSVAGQLSFSLSRLKLKFKWSSSMVKLYSLCVLYKGATKANLLKVAYDLSSFGFFQRSRCVNMFFHDQLVESMATFSFLSCLPKVTMLCFPFISVQEFMTFTSALIVERSTQGSRASVKEQGNQKTLTHPESEDQSDQRICFFKIMG